MAAAAGNVQGGAAGLALDVDGDVDVVGVDGVMTARYVLGLREAQRVAGMPGGIRAAAMSTRLEALLP